MGFPFTNGNTSQYRETTIQQLFLVVALEKNQQQLKKRKTLCRFFDESGTVQRGTARNGPEHTRHVTRRNTQTEDTQNVKDTYTHVYTIRNYMDIGAAATTTKKREENGKMFRSVFHCEKSIEKRRRRRHFCLVIESVGQHVSEAKNRTDSIAKSLKNNNSVQSDASNRHG